MDFKIEEFKSYDDKRGRLVVFLREGELDPKLKEFGQIYFVTFNEKDTIRGNHYHQEWREWFGVVTGKLKVILEDVITKKREEFILDANNDEYIRLEIGPNIAHTFINISPNASLLNYANSEWSEEDTLPYKLI